MQRLVTDLQVETRICNSLLYIIYFPLSAPSTGSWGSFDPHLTKKAHRDWLKKELPTNPSLLPFCTAHSPGAPQVVEFSANEQ